MTQQCSTFVQTSVQAGLVAISLLFGTMLANADVKVVSIRRAFDQADLVLVVQVYDKENLIDSDTECGVRYYGKILSRLKGEYATKAKFIFGRYPGLTPGFKYLLFLKYVAEPDQEFERIAAENPQLGKPSIAEREKVLELIRCKGTVPGYTFDSTVAWRIDQKSIRVSGIRPIELMDQEIPYSSNEPLEWEVQTDQLFSYLRKLGLSQHRRR